MDELVSARDRAALFTDGITIVSAATQADGRLALLATGGDEERVAGVLRKRLGEAVDVQVIDAYPRVLEATRCVGHMEREPGRLQLRWVLAPDDAIADVVVVEDDESVVVLGLLARPWERGGGDRYELATSVYLEQPLGDRIVYDACDGAPVRFKNVYAELEQRMHAGG